jgi:methionyl aminopeptidase
MRALRAFVGGRQPPVRPVSAARVTARRLVPAHIRRPPYASSGIAWEAPDDHPIEIKNKDQIAAMRRSCLLAAKVLESAGGLVKPNVTTDAIDHHVHEQILRAGAYPSPLNYNHFPKSCCTSINEVMCHGIPDTRPLEDGDIVSIDITVFLDGQHGDCCATFHAGEPRAQDVALLQAGRDALAAGIQAVAPGAPFSQIGAEIERLTRSKGYKVVPDFSGHGIGSHFHTTPTIIHCRNSYPGVMQPGMTFTIEPIIVVGSPRFTIWPDKWTAVSKDLSRSAQFEHTVLVTASGAEVLTKLPQAHTWYLSISCSSSFISGKAL